MANPAEAASAIAEAGDRAPTSHAPQLCLGGTAGGAFEALVAEALGGAMGVTEATGVTGGALDVDAVGAALAEVLVLGSGGAPASSTVGALRVGVPSSASTDLGTGLFDAAFGRHQISPQTDAPRVRQFCEKP